MCLAMRELKNDWRAEGKEEGIEEGFARGMEQGVKQGIMQGVVLTIDNIMRKLSCSLEDACEIAEKTPEEYHRIKQLLL